MKHLWRYWSVNVITNNVWDGSDQGRRCNDGLAIGWGRAVACAVLRWREKYKLPFANSLNHHHKEMHFPIILVLSLGFSVAANPVKRATCGLKDGDKCTSGANPSTVCCGNSGKAPEFLRCENGVVSLGSCGETKKCHEKFVLGGNDNQIFCDWRNDLGLSLRENYGWLRANGKWHNWDDIKNSKS